MNLFLQFVMDQLAALERIDSQAMFGGHGLYCEGVFFGIVYKETLFLKTDDSTRLRYEAAGMGPFQPRPKQTLKSYYEVPADILEDREQLAVWARDAVACQDDPPC